MTESLSIQADIAELIRVIEWMDGVADRLDLPLRTRYAIDLCLEEALSNIIRHGFPKGLAGPTDGRVVRVDVSRSDDIVTVTIKDNGMAYDPLATPAPARPSTLAGTVIGGLGVQLMRRFTQQMDYQRRDKTNCLTLRISTAEPAPDAA